MPHKPMKRIASSVPDRTYKMLSAWADRDGQSMSSLIAYLLKKLCEEEEREGRLPTEDE